MSEVENGVMPYRKNVPQNNFFRRLLYKEICHHFDAWLITATEGRLFLYVSTMAGGRKLLDAYYREILTRPDGSMWLGVEQRGEPPRGLIRRVSLQSQELKGRYASINDLHWHEVVPLAWALPAGFKSISVALHYISTAGVPDDPFDGMDNYYDPSKVPNPFGRTGRKLKAEPVAFDPLTLPGSN